MTRNFNREDILRTAQIFHAQGDIWELRIPKAGRFKTISGYFDNAANFADAVIGLADEELAGYYFTANPVQPDLFARSANKPKKYADETTADGNITYRRWLLIDLDPIRPAGISSNQTEHDAALQMARNIREWLITQGWPVNAFVLADSGNGGHLAVKIDLPNDTEATNTIASCLQALDSRFTDVQVKVDTTTYNAARIWKIYGTMARKGSNVPDRPHRLAQIIKAPKVMDAVTREQLETLAAMKPKAEPIKSTTSSTAFDPARYAKEHGANVTKIKQGWIDPTGKKWTLAILEECPFNADHNRSEAWVGIADTGERGFGCPHEGCRDNGWQALKKRWGSSNGDHIPKSEPESDSGLNKFPKLEDLTKATGRTKRIDPATGEEDPDPETIDGMVPKLTLSPSKASKAMSEYMPMRISAEDTKENQKLWRYNGKIWKADGERQVINTIDAVLGDLSYERGLKETLRRIRGTSDAVTFDSSPYLFPALDKVIDLQTGEARDYMPDDYLTFQYATNLDDPKSDSRPILWHLCSSLPDPKDVLTALDIATGGFIRLPLEAIIQLIGSGGNGKGIFEKTLIKLATLERVAAITLAEAKASRFGPGAVLSKDFWILSEVEDVKSTINLLKKVATGEFTDSDTKYGERIKGKPHVLPILDCNDAIDFGDDSWGRKRRVIKLDFPYTFDYTPGTRLKDPHMEELVTSPEALSGLLKIITARAPYLCRSRKIYTRKRPEEMDAEYKRQQYSLHYFCEECLTTDSTEARDKTPGNLPEKLSTDILYNEYKEYCHLFNVPVPAEKGQIGKYIHEKFDLLSVSTKENNKPIRYYPGLWISKAAITAHAELRLSYSSCRSATDQLQIKDRENDNNSLLATVATEEWPIWVIREIELMFKYIESCDDPQKISYKDYLKNAVAPVAAEAKDHSIAITEKSPVAKPKLCCSYQTNHTSNSGNASVDTSVVVMSKIDRPTPSTGLRLERDLDDGGNDEGGSPPAQDSVRIRFRTDYKTDLPGRPYEVVEEGTIVDLPPDRAEHYIGKGVAEVVE